MSYILRAGAYQIATNAGVRQSVIDLPDAAYALPRKDYITGEFAGWLAGALKAWGLTYTDESWDCDNFSELARVMAQIAHRRTLNSDDALAFGFFEYLRQDYTGHSICCAICSETPDKLSFFEPQPNFGVLKPMDLNTSEIVTCVKLRM